VARVARQRGSERRDGAAEGRDNVRHWVGVVGCGLNAAWNWDLDQLKAERRAV
jgi:hypothetical protein